MKETNETWTHHKQVLLVNQNGHSKNNNKFSLFTLPIFFKKIQNVFIVMYVSWPVPWGNGSNTAPQGDGIWVGIGFQNNVKTMV